MAARIAFGIAVALATYGAQEPGLPPDAVVLPETIAKHLLGQCSRDVPPAYDDAGQWQPSAEDIAALEAVLPQALIAASAREANEFREAPRGWRRQYGGFLRGGRRFIYGNFFPHRGAGFGHWDKDWRQAPVMICDGGHAFFGVEYDVEGRRITHVDFNGYA